MSLQRILTAGPGFVDCSALGEGRTYYLAGANPNTGVTIEAGTSTAAGPGAPVGYLPSSTQGNGSIRLANDNSTFLRFTVTSGSLGPNGTVWVTGPEAASAAATPFLFWGVDVLDLRAVLARDIPPGSRVAGLTPDPRNVPIRLAVQTKIAVMSVAFEGSALNAPGSTIVYDLMDGFGVILASSPALPATAGPQAASVPIPAAVQVRGADSDLQIRATANVLLADLVTRARVGVS